MTTDEMKDRKTALGLTNEMIAEAADIPLSTVQKIMSGATKAPRMATLVAIEAVLREEERRRRETPEPAPGRNYTYDYVPEEKGTAEDIFYRPCHEYTKGLLRSIPTVDDNGEKLQPISGTPIDLLNMPKGCPFAPRCDNAMKICMRARCERMEINDKHAAACWMNVRKAVKGE